MQNLWDKIKIFLAKNIYNSNGRINRMQYLKYRIALFIFGLALIVIIAIISNIFRLINDLAGSIVAAILLLAMAIPIFLGDLLLGIRRCHDLNRTGWLFAFILVPYLNILLTLYLMCWRGSKGCNDYGEEPGSENLDSNSNSIPDSTSNQIPKVSLVKKATLR